MTNIISSTYKLEEGTELQLDFSKLSKVTEQCSNIIPVAVQNADTKDVILVAYTNEKAFQESIKTRIVTFWSTTRNELWVKGGGSGNTFKLLEIRVNCEQNSLVYIVRANKEGICHTSNTKGKARDCYYRRFNMESGLLENLDP